MSYSQQSYIFISFYCNIHFTLYLYSGNQIIPVWCIILQWNQSILEWCIQWDQSIIKWCKTILEFPQRISCLLFNSWSCSHQQTTVAFIHSLAGETWKADDFVMTPEAKLGHTCQWHHRHLVGDRPWHPCSHVNQICLTKR